MKTFQIYLATTSLLLLTLLLGACHSTPAKTRPTFPTPPEELTEPVARANYIIEHVWEGIEQLDTAAFPIFKEEEQFFVDYFTIASLADSLTTLESLRQFLTISTEPMRLEVLNIAQTYLAKATSPLHNGELFLMFFDEAARQKLLDESDLAIYQDWRQDYLLNKVGTLAKDFTYQDIKGQIHTLYQTPIQGDQLLLYFYDPHCDRCLETLAELQKSSTFTTALQSGQLTMLSIYSGRDQERWQKKLKLQPKEALQGIEPEQLILRTPLYNTYPIPAIYLLDRDYHVLAKQITPDQLIERLKGEGS